MAAPIVYKSTDANAPTLNGQKGSLIAVLKACLVNGYGAKAAAGWTIALEDAPNYKIIFRNNTVNGTGRYFRVQDNGRIAADGAGSYYAQDRSCVAAIVGMHSYTGMDAPVNTFPRVMTGGDYHNSYAYGVTIRKSYTTSNPTYVKPWIVIADSRTCYLITYSSEANSTTIPTENSFANTRYINGFGDIKVFNPAISTIAKSFVMGMPPGTLDVSLRPGFVGEVHRLSLPQLWSGYYTDPYIFLDKSIDTPSRTVSGLCKAMYYPSLVGGYCVTGATTSQYLPYPSPLSASYEVQPVMLAENANDAIRGTRYVSQNGLEVGVFPGLYGCLHTTASGAYFAIDQPELGTITKDGKSYMIYSICGTDATVTSQLLAFDLGDWWA